MGKYFTLTDSHLKGMISALPAQGNQLAQETARYGEGRVKENIVAVGAVDTGNMLNSVAARQLALAIWLLYVSAEYAAFVNYGTYKMRARPFWEQAWLDMARFMEQRAKGLLLR